MAQPRTARLGLGFLWGVLGFSLIGIIAVISRSGDGRVDEYEQQRAENRLKTRLELDEAASKKLSEYAWVNKEKGIVAIPIDRAMELTVAELQTRTVGPSDEKAVIMPTLLVPPTAQESATSESPEAPATAAPEGETKAAPAAEGTPAETTAPAKEAAPAAPATESGKDAATPATPATAPAAPAATPDQAETPAVPAETPATPATAPAGEASPAAPAAPEAPSEP